MRLQETHTEATVDAAGDGHATRSDARGRAPRRAGRGRRIAAKIATLIVVGAAGVWAWYANFGSGGSSMDMAMRVTSPDTAVPVTVVLAERGRVTGTVTYTGTVAPFNEEDVFPRVTGRLVDMPVYPGDAVRAGQLVARLDDVELMSKVREAEAMAATAQANRAQMDADLVGAQHGIVQMEREIGMVDAELTYAQSVAARSERLLASGAISRQEYENDRSMAASLEAKRDAARAKLEQARAMEVAARRKVQAADAMVAQGGAALRTATVVRDYVNIVTPTSGYVVKRLVAPGVLVQPGMAILKIAQLDRVRLQANVGERDLASVRVGARVVVTTTATAQPPIVARVTSVFPFIEPGSRTGVVEALVDNPGRRFLPGQYVNMQFVVGEREEALSVPRSAVARMGGKTTIWVVRDGRAEPHDVVVGLESPDRLEIVSGLRPGDSVVVRGHEGLYAGARIAQVQGSPSPGGGDTAGPRTQAPPSPPASAPGKPRGGEHAGH